MSVVGPKWESTIQSLRKEITENKKHIKKKKNEPIKNEQEKRKVHFMDSNSDAEQKPFGIALNS